MHNPNLNFDQQRVEQLIAAQCNGSLSPAELDELQKIIAESPQARALYWEHMSIHAGLRWIHSSKSECDKRLADLEDLENSETSSREVALAQRVGSPSSSWVRWLPLAIAATLLIAVWLNSSRDDGNPELAGETQTQRLAANREVLGTLTPLSADCRWSFGIPGEKNRQEFRIYDSLWLDRGAAELRLVNGTIAQLEAPLILELVSLDCARVLRGRVTIDVSESAKGMIVETAAAEIVDLGTIFSVDVTDFGNTDVVVFQGEVDVSYLQSQLKEGVKGIESTRRLRTGEAARVNENGTLSRIVNVRRTDFTEKRIDACVMKEVRDNVVRDQTMKYYEIVAGGMREDVEAFVDREYQWNGVDKNGIPEYLLGGDYVKTFNDDKVTENLQLTVMFERPAMLYLLVDDRLQEPSWLSDQFEDTGDDVGMDERHHSLKSVRELAVGPGESIDQVHSIWKRKVLHGETITIGPNGPLSPEATSMGTKAGLNMFGIVSVALPADNAQ